MNTEARLIGGPATAGLIRGMMAAFAVAALVLTAHAETTKDIPYGEADGQPLLLDAHVPDGSGPFPVAILVHGGGWSSGDKSGSNHPGDGADISPWFQTFSDANYTWFSVNYRLAPKNRWPTGFEDVENAIRWVKAHATEYKGDPKRIVLVGHSSGGHYVMFAATRKDPSIRVNAVVGFAPVTDLVSDSERRGGVSPSLQNLFGVTKEITPETRKRLEEVSPLTYVHAGMPPVLIVHGDADRSVPIQQSIAFIAKLREDGVPCEMITRKGVPHSLVQGEKIDASYKQPMLEWLDRVLNGKGMASSRTEPKQTAANR
jgi:alpha-L-fucosidase 2